MATSSTKPKTETQYDAVIESYLKRYDDRPVVGYALACDEIMTGISKHIIHDALTYDSSNSKTYVAELRTLELCIKQMKRTLVPAEFDKVKQHYERNNSKRDAETGIANRVLHPQYAVPDVDLGINDRDIFVPMDETERDEAVDDFCATMSYVDGEGRAAYVSSDGTVRSDVDDADNADNITDDADSADDAEAESVDVTDTGDEVCDNSEHGEPQQLSLDDAYPWFNEQTYVETPDNDNVQSADAIHDDDADENDESDKFVPCEGQMQLDFGDDDDVDGVSDDSDVADSHPTFMTPSGSDFKTMDVSDVVAVTNVTDDDGDDETGDNASKSDDEDQHIAQLDHLADASGEGDNADNGNGDDETVDDADVTDASNAVAYEDVDVPETHHSRSDIGSALAAMASVKGFDMRTHKLPIDVNGEPILVGDNVWRIDSKRLGKVMSIRIDGNVDVDFGYLMTLHGSQLTHTNPHKPKPSGDNDIKIPMTGAVHIPDDSDTGDDGADGIAEQDVVDADDTGAANDDMSGDTDVEKHSEDVADDLSCGNGDTGDGTEDVDEDEDGSDVDDTDDTAASDDTYDGPRGIDGFPYTVVSCDADGNIIDADDMPEPYLNYAVSGRIGKPLARKRTMRRNDADGGEHAVKPWSDVSPFADTNKMGRVAPKVDVPEDVVDRMIERLESRVGEPVYSETYLGLPISDDNPVGGFDFGSTSKTVDA